MMLVACGTGDGSKARVEPTPNSSGSSGSASGSGSRSAATPTPHGWKLAELPVTAGTPFELRDLKVMQAVLFSNGKATSETDTLELRVTVTPTGTIGLDDRLTILTTCRMHDLNLTFDEDRMSQRDNIMEVVAKHAGEIASIYRATPFSEEPEHCELVLRHRTGKLGARDAKATTVATACLHDRTLEAGACPSNTFPAPTAPTGVGVVIAPKVETAFKPGSLVITGVFTVFDTLGADEDLGSQWRCSDGKKIITSSKGGDSYSFWTPRALVAGRSAHGNLTSFVDGDGDPTRCQVALVARSAIAKTQPRSLGTYCVDKAGTVTAGACTPKI